jgi:hypothetical protein
MSDRTAAREPHTGLQAVVAADRSACRDVDAAEARLLAAEAAERGRIAQASAAAADAALARLDAEVAAIEADGRARGEARRAARDAARAARRRLADAALPDAVAAYVAIVRGAMGGGP